MASRKRIVIWSLEAEQDLFDIWAYLAAEASARTAEKYLRDIDRACQRIRIRPLSGRSRNEVMPGLRSVLVPPYVVFYRVTDFTVGIVRVVHGRRDLDALFADDTES
jgi:toxin ParE1/3/4